MHDTWCIVLWRRRSWCTMRLWEWKKLHLFWQKKYLLWTEHALATEIPIYTSAYAFQINQQATEQKCRKFFFHFVLPSCCYFVNSSRKHPQCQCIGTEKKVFRKHFTIFDGNLNPVLKYRAKQKSNEWDTKKARERECSASSEIHALKLVWSISNGLSNIACMCVC